MKIWKPKMEVNVWTNNFPDFHWVILSWFSCEFSRVSFLKRGTSWMILEQNSRAPKILPLFLVKKGKVVGHPLNRMLNSRPLRLFWNPQHHLLGWLGRQSSSFTVESSSFTVHRYVLNCTPVRSNGGVSNFYEKDRQRVNSQRRMMVESKPRKW